MPALDRHDDVFILNFGDTENRFHPDWIASVNAALTEVEKATGPRALVTTATGKFYSNGLDLEWAAAHPGQLGEYRAQVQELLARVLSFPLITVTAIQGHAFGAGAMLTLAHDFRVMRADRGFWCLPEADIGMAFSPGMAALIQCRLTPQAAHEAMLTSRRYGGTDAAAAGIVGQALSEDSLRAAAVRIAAAQAAKADGTVGAIKAQMYGPVLATLRDTAARG